MTIELPEPLQSLVSELGESHGMREVDRRTHRAFGNCLIDFAGGPLRIRIVRDRGQWFIDVADAHQKSQWYDVDLLRLLLGGAPADSLIPIEDQVQFVRAHLPALVKLFNTNTSAATHSKLAALAKRRSIGMLER